VSATTLRIATWNVRGLRAGVEPVAAAVSAQRVDILLVQESGPRRRLRALGAVLGMSVLPDPPAFPRRRIKNAVLMRAAEVARYELLRFSQSSLRYPRGASIAHLDDGLMTVSVHLGLSGPERGRHIKQLLSTTGSSTGRFVIGGDLNVIPGEPGPSAIATVATDCWAAVGEGAGFTFPADVPAARIDYLFAGPAVQPLRAWTAGGTASDHLMVVADVMVSSTTTR
jgi:endonuclease/exonuclease/phosphatase family metal-dependent hydrolase